MVQATLPSLPRGQITDPRTGQINQAWRQFFHDLWLRTGGGQDAVGDAGAKLVNITPTANGEVVFVENGILETDSNFFYENSTNRLFFGGNSAATAKAIIESTGAITIQDDSVALKFGTGSDAAISYDGTNLVINPKLAGSGFVRITGKLEVDEDLVVTGNSELNGDLEHTGTNLGFFGETPSIQQTGYTTFANLTPDRTLDVTSTTLVEVANVLGTLIEDLKAKGLISA